ncbi:MAG: DUF58 domain-containing protein [Lachnospiraceae bacterium]|nr:DUF58 domain-containing protein [Lachnospiraceae bacterium]
MKRSRWIYLALLLLSLVAISFYGGAVSFGFFFAVLIFPLIALVYILLVWLQFKIYQKTGSRNIVCDTPVSYEFILQNEDFFSFAGIRVFFYSDFSTLERLPDEMDYEILPGQRYSYETTLRCKYRGEYEVGVKEVVITDFSGLLRIRFRVREPKRVIVSPRYVRLEQLRTLPDLSTLQLRSTSRMQSEPDVLTREYQPGDPLRQIHWKASAAAGTLMTRLLAGEEKTEAVILYDTARYFEDPKEYLPVENKVLEILLALAGYLSERHVPVRTLSDRGGTMAEYLRGLEGFEDFYESVCRVRFDPDFGGLRKLEQMLAAREVTESMLIFLVLQKADLRVLSLTQRLFEAGAMLVIYAVTEEESEEFFRLSEPGRRLCRIRPEEDLEAVL